MKPDRKGAPPRRGFTLIELLIVVAIIATLAAIAVPNMLEAQVRAKVSRTHSDLRSIATALEAYRVDTNRYPRADFVHLPSKRLQYLTTPVGYMTTLPADPFYRLDSSQVWGLEPLYIFASGNLYHGGAAIYDNAQYINTVYALSGRGPNGALDFAYCAAHPSAIESAAPARYSYDPTNGTVSSGDIIRLSPGSMGAAASSW